MSADSRPALTFTTLAGAREVGVFAALTALEDVAHAVTTRRGWDVAMAKWGTKRNSSRTRYPGGNRVIVR